MTPDHKMSKPAVPTKHIICVGAIYVDTILSVDGYPEEDSKSRASRVTHRRGGNVGNTLEVLSQLVYRQDGADATDCQAPSSGDMQLYLLSVLPNECSKAVQLVRNSLKNVKLDKSCVFRPDHTEPASSYIINNERNASRTIISYNELPEMTIQEFVARAFSISHLEDAHPGWYHFEGRNEQVITQAVNTLSASRELEGFKISVECEKPERAEFLGDIANQADLVFFSRGWAEYHGHFTPLAFLESVLLETKEDALLCLTWGEGGAYCVQKLPGGQFEWAEVPAWQPHCGPGDVIDTIGAGDTFIAGMLYAVTHHTNWRLAQKLAYANELAGRKVYQEGFEGLVAKTQPCTT